MKDVNSEYVSEYIKSKQMKNSLYGKTVLNDYQEQVTYNGVYETLATVFHEFHEAIFNYMHTEKLSFEDACTLLPISLIECLKSWDKGNASKSEKRIIPFVHVMDAVINILNGEEDVNYIGTDFEYSKEDQQ